MITCFHFLVLAIIVGVFAAIVTLGIMMLSIWKFIDARKEKIEFEKFKKEQESSQWGRVSTVMFIYIIHAHACIFITLMHTCTQKSIYCLLYQNSNIRQ